MNQSQKDKLQKTADHYNEKARKDGSDYRLLLTDDIRQPFVLVNLLENATFPRIFREEYVRKNSRN